MYYAKKITFANKAYRASHDVTKQSITVFDPTSAFVQDSRISSNMQRISFELEHNRKYGICTLFGMLSFNDKSVKRYLGKRVFDHNRLKAFRQCLQHTFLRRYGLTALFSITTEMGADGLSHGVITKRKGNNPHYHFLVYLYNALNHKYPCKIYSSAQLPTFAKEVDHIIKYLWQGGEIDYDKSPDDVFSYYKIHKVWLTAKNGKCGLNLEDNYGIVNNNVSAASYLTKYCSKDTAQFKLDRDIYKKLLSKYLSLKPSYLNNEVWKQTFIDFRNLHNPTDLTTYEEYVDKSLRSSAYAEYRDYLREYGQKTFHSRGVGSYALEHVDTYGKIRIFYKNSVIRSSLCPYLFRKFYYKSVKNPFTGSFSFIPNDKLIQKYKDEYFSKVDTIANMLSVALTNIGNVSLYSKFYEEFRNDISLPSLVYQDDFFRSIDSSVIHKLAEFNLVYDGRCYDSTSTPILCPDKDYSRFLDQSIQLDFNDKPFTELISDIPYIPYSLHPDYFQYMPQYRVLLAFADYLDNNNRQYKKEQREKSKLIKQHHNFYKYGT